MDIIKNMKKLLFILLLSLTTIGNAMINHISISVINYQQSLNFYDQTFATLGYERVMSFDNPCQVAGYGKDGVPSFWISQQGNEEEFIGKARGVHFAFLAPSVQAVNEWYAKCIELGATDNGKPGPRPEYHPGYYGAFVIDPNGWRIEACFHNYKK